MSQEFRQLVDKALQELLEKFPYVSIQVKDATDTYTVMQDNRVTK